MTGGFRIYFWCRVCPAVCETLAAYSHPLHILMSTFPTYEDIPRAMLFGTLDEQKKTLSKGTFSYILALARAKASQRCGDATKTGCSISMTLRVGHEAHGSGVTSESGGFERLWNRHLVNSEVFQHEPRNPMKGQLPNNSNRVRQNMTVVAVATGFPDYIPVTVDQDEAVDVVQTRDGNRGSVGLLDNHRPLGRRPFVLYPE